MRPSLPDHAADQIEHAILHGNKILAIKLYREATGEGLKDSKDFVEALERDLRVESPERFAKGPRKAGCTVSVGAFLLALGGLAALIF